MTDAEHLPQFLDDFLAAQRKLGQDLAAGPFVGLLPLEAAVTVHGLFIACVACGAVVVPGLMDAHRRHHEEAP